MDNNKDKPEVAKPEEASKENRIPSFSFILDGEGITFEKANDLLDIICCFANSHGWSVGGGLTMLTQEEFDKEFSEDKDDSDE